MRRSRKYFLLYSLSINGATKSEAYNNFLVNMNRKNTGHLIEDEEENQQEKIEYKTFKQDDFKIDYSNTSKIIYQEPIDQDNVRVNNYLCYQDGNKLHKVTEIIYQDKIIRIEDCFDVNINTESKKGYNAPWQEKCTRNRGHNEKIRIFNNDIFHTDKAGKKDKKNIVKNIVKLFLTWLEKRPDSFSCAIASDQLKELLEKENFNNRLIKGIITNSKISEVFLEFIRNDGQTEIRSSRIQDKQSHYEALQLYTKLLTEQSDINISGHSSSHGISNKLGTENHLKSSLKRQLQSSRNITKQQH